MKLAAERARESGHAKIILSSVCLVHRCRGRPFASIFHHISFDCRFPIFLPTEQKYLCVMPAFSTTWAPKSLDSERGQTKSPGSGGWPSFDTRGNHRKRLIGVFYSYNNSTTFNFRQGLRDNAMVGLRKVKLTAGHALLPSSAEADANSKPPNTGLTALASMVTMSAMLPLPCLVTFARFCATSGPPAATRDCICAVFQHRSTGGLAIDNAGH